MGLFVRKVRTASGATAVQIAQTRRGVQTIVEHLGSAHDDERLAVLVAAARQKIAAGQAAFDLEGLATGPPLSGAPTVVGSRSRVLWDVLEGAWARLGLEAVGDDAFKKIVLARVVEPVSKADTLRVLEELGVPGAPSLRTVWRTLARCVEKDWRAASAKAAHAHAARGGALTLVLYGLFVIEGVSG